MEDFERAIRFPLLEDILKRKGGRNYATDELVYMSVVKWPESVEWTNLKSRLNFKKCMNSIG